MISRRDNNPIDITLDDIMPSFPKLYIQIDGFHKGNDEVDERCCKILKETEECFIIRSRPSDLENVPSADANPILVSNYYNNKNDITQSVQNIYDAIKHNLKSEFLETDSNRKITPAEWKQILNIVRTFVSM